MGRKATKDELEYINLASQMLELPTSTWATGTVLFHRYCSFVEQSKPESEPLDPKLCGMLCLYLATKVTEEPRKQRDIINVGYKLSNPSKSFLKVGETLHALRDSMTQGELVLMKALGFNINVELPHKWIAYILNGMCWWENNGMPPEDTETVHKRVKAVARTAWKIANDIVIAGLADGGSPRRLGAACIVMAMEQHNEPLPAKDLDEWCDIWAKTSSRKISEMREFIEQHVQFSK